MNGEKVLNNGACVPNKITVVLGAQWGDEGKGKVVDMLAKDADLVCRCQVNIISLFHSFGPSFRGRALIMCILLGRKQCWSHRCR